MTLDSMQKELLTLAQSAFPISHDPYAKMGEKIGASADQAYAMMQELRSEGYVRRLGPVFDSYRLGYVSTLCATSIATDGLDEPVEFINSFPNVTHNYLREHKYNVWFTVIAHGSDELQGIIRSIEDHCGLEVLQLPAIRLFKIKVDFKVTDDLNEERSVCECATEASTNADSAPAPSTPKAIIPGKVILAELSDDDKALIRIAQSDRFDSRFPFTGIAEQISSTLYKTVSEQQVITRFLNWKDSGTIRRFGLTLRHHKVGFSANVMGVWNVPDDQVEQAGAIMSLERAVSHCYERPRVSDWPHNLYTMIHGQSREECDGVMVSIRNALEKGGILVDLPQKLYTVSEFKKRSMRYFCEQ